MAPSPRCYPQELPPFVYPASVELVRLGQRGRLRWNHRDWRISEALSGLEVGVERIGERAVVWFRSTPLRELDLQTAPIDPCRSRSPARFRAEFQAGQSSTGRAGLNRCPFPAPFPALHRKV